MSAQTQTFADEAHTPPSRETPADALYRRILDAAAALVRSPAEARLRESEHRAAHVADMAPALISQLDREQRYLYVSKGYEAWFGRSREDVIGKTTAQVLGEAAAARIQPYVKRVLQGEEVRFESHQPLPCGTRWIEARYVPDRDAAGEVRGFFALVIDISERKKSEAELAQAMRQKDALYQLSERLHRAASLQDVYDAALDSILSALHCQRASILLFDAAGVMRFVGWRGLSEGYRAAVEGHSPWARDALDPQPICIEAIDTADFSDELKAVIAAEGVGALAFFPLVCAGRLIGKFMAYFDASRTLSRDDVELGMTIARQLAFGVDRRRAEEKLLASESRFREIIDALPAAVYTTDAEGRLTHFNPAAAAFSGRTPELGTDRWCVSWKLYYPDGSPMPHGDCPMSLALRDNRLTHGKEAIVERPDGERRWFVPYPTPLRDVDGRIVGGVNMLVDVTERKQAEEALKEADRRKDEFLAMLAHELRNPLAPIANAIQLLRRNKPEDPVQQQAHAIIDRQAGRLTRLVDDLLEVSRITTGRIQLHMERIALGGAVERALESVRALIEQHRHALQLTLPPDPIWVYGDAARLEQVFVNLLNNAAKYTDDGGRIQVLVETADAQALVRVVDNGIGVEPELLPRIFDLFTQAERSLDRSQGGLGIGLSLVQRLTAKHGGAVEAKSVLGRGSEFIVRLPLAAETGAAHTPRGAAAARSPGRALRVLVVDDNVDAAQSLAMLLEASGHRVWLAHDGREALEAVSRRRPHVVFLDIGLPQIDGYEAARRLRANRAPGLVALVAMTGYGQASDQERSREAGFDRHLVKPADFASLEAILAEAEAAVASPMESVGD